MSLANGQIFPTITASRVSGSEVTIPQDVAGKWTVLLFYRGHWCPYCRQQLIDFQRATEQLHALGVEVVALSVDPLEQAQQTVERHNLTFPVLYGLNAQEVAQKIGANINEDPLFLQATGFVLQPDGKVAVSVYSSGAIGRLVAADTANFIKYRQQKAQ
ncbi:MAG: redoxin domain-containing protein [Ktedonobacteraceae bacterium]